MHSLETLKRLNEEGDKPRQRDTDIDTNDKDIKDKDKSKAEKLGLRPGIDTTIVAVCLSLLVSCVALPTGKELPPPPEQPVVNEMEQELEQVRKNNAVYRKLKAAGCSRENLLLKEVTAIAGKTVLRYECKLESGPTVVVEQIDDTWIIYTEKEAKKNDN